MVLDAWLESAWRDMTEIVQSMSVPSAGVSISNDTVVVGRPSRDRSATSRGLVAHAIISTS